MDPDHFAPADLSDSEEFEPEEEDPEEEPQEEPQEVPNEPVDFLGEMDPEEAEPNVPSSPLSPPHASSSSSEGRAVPLPQQPNPVEQMQHHLDHLAGQHATLAFSHGRVEERQYSIGRTLVRHDDEFRTIKTRQARLEQQREQDLQGQRTAVAQVVHRQDDLQRQIDHTRQVQSAGTMQVMQRQDNLESWIGEAQTAQAEVVAQMAIVMVNQGQRIQELERHRDRQDRMAQLQLVSSLLQAVRVVWQWLRR